MKCVELGIDNDRCWNLLKVLDGHGLDQGANVFVSPHQSVIAMPDPSSTRQSGRVVNGTMVLHILENHSGGHKNRRMQQLCWAFHWRISLALPRSATGR